MSATTATTRDLARRAYERARLVHGATIAALFAVVLGILTVVRIGVPALVWLPVSAIAWTFLEQRGASWLRGGRAGAIGGALALLLPASVLDGCCAAGCAMTGGACCKMAGGCIAVGVLIGFAVAAWLARRRDTDRRAAALGAALGLVATAVPRCSTMVLAEALGLLAGLVAGTIVATFVTAMIDRARQPA